MHRTVNSPREVMWIQGLDHVRGHVSQELFLITLNKRHWEKKKVLKLLVKRNSCFGGKSEETSRKVNLGEINPWTECGSCTATGSADQYCPLCCCWQCVWRGTECLDRCSAARNRDTRLRCPKPWVMVLKRRPCGVSLFYREAMKAAGNLAVNAFVLLPEKRHWWSTAVKKTFLNRNTEHLGRKKKKMNEMK